MSHSDPDVSVIYDSDSNGEQVKRLRLERKDNILLVHFIVEGQEHARSFRYVCTGRRLVRA